MRKSRFQIPAIIRLIFTAVILFSLHIPVYPRTRQLNVLLITVDTLRADYLGCYGNKKIGTPSIDSLAEAGILFEYAYAHNVVTLPSHANIMTGTYPIFHGIRDDIGFRLDGRFVTLAEILKKNGYKTAAFVGAFVLDSKFGLDQGFDLYDDFYGASDSLAEFSMVERRAEKVIESALEWLEAGGRTRWFCWIHLFDPHIPYRPPQPFKDKYKQDLYAGEVAYVDFSLRRLLEYIKSTNQARETLVVLTSDHGESLGEHEERTHGIFAYNSTLHIPLIFHLPRIFRKPKVIQKRARHIDILPTILEILKIDVPRDVQGRSLLTLLKKSKSWKVDDSYFEAMTAHLNSDWAPLQGILSGDFKYINLPIKELYDVRSDPREEKNLARNKKSVVNELDNRLNKLLNEYSALPSLRGQRRREDLETLRKLEALGYVGGGSTKFQKKVYTQKDDPKKLIDLHNSMLEAIDVYHDEGEAEEAARIFQDILSQRPTFSRIYSHLAFIYRQRGRLNEAIETLEKALSLGVEEHSILSKLGVYYQEAERYRESAEVLEVFIERYPEDPNAYNYLGVSYWRLGKLEKAVETFKKLFALDSTHASGHNNLGSVYLSQKKISLAVQQFEAALKVAPRMAAAYNGLGVAYANQKNYDEAIKNWQRAVELDDRQYDALYNLGVLLTKRGEFDSALEYIEKFIKNAPPAKYEKDIKKMKKLMTRIKSRNN